MSLQLVGTKDGLKVCKLNTRKRHNNSNENNKNNNTITTTTTTITMEYRGCPFFSVLKVELGSPDRLCTAGTRGGSADVPHTGRDRHGVFIRRCISGRSGTGRGYGTSHEDTAAHHRPRLYTDCAQPRQISRRRTIHPSVNILCHRARNRWNAAPVCYACHGHDAYLPRDPYRFHRYLFGKKNNFLFFLLLLLYNYVVLPVPPITILSNEWRALVTMEEAR